MLTFYYDDYRVHIDDTGRVEYVRLDDVPAIPVVVNDPPAVIVMLAGEILRLVATDVVKAKMRVARASEAVRIATEDVVNANNAAIKAKLAGITAMSARIALSETLKKAEEALQLARVEHTGKAV